MRKINNLYNNSYHTTLKATPEEILNRKINKNIQEKPKKIYKYNVGDSVRIYIKNDQYDCEGTCNLVENYYYDAKRIIDKIKKNKKDKKNL